MKRRASARAPRAATTSRLGAQCCACGAALGAALSAAAAAGAEPADATYPVRPVRLIVPFAAGGANDLIARPVAAKLHEFLGHPVVVENRGGAGGSIGAEMAARSAPDGYTLLWGSASTLAINPAFSKSVGYDPVRDFSPVSLVSQLPLLIVAHPSLPVHNVKELVALAKRYPGRLNYGSIGPGTINHLTGALFAHAARIDLAHVPYKGGAPGLHALLAGDIELQVSTVNTMLPFVKTGRVRAIAITGPARSPLLPDVETLVEAGYKDLNVRGWGCIVAPAGVARPIVERLNAEIRRAVASPEIRKVFVTEGTEPVASSAEELAALIRAELPRWAAAIKLAGIKPE